MSKDVKGFRVKKAIFPEGTEKLDTHEECNHCKEPLFFAFRKSDLHPVLACIMCGRLYLSKATPKLLTRAKNELIMNEDEKRSLFSFQSEKNSDKDSQITRKNAELHLGGNPTNLPAHSSGLEENSGVDKKTSMSSPELNVGWQPASHFLSSQSKSTFYKRYQAETDLKNPEKGLSDIYELNFQINENKTRTRVYDTLLSINAVYSGQCWVSQCNQMLIFRAKHSVKKDLVKIILQTVGQLCGFNLQYGHEPNSELLKENPAHLTDLLAVLKHLGQNWRKKSLKNHKQHEKEFYSGLLASFLWDQVKDTNFVRNPVLDT